MSYGAPVPLISMYCGHIHLPGKGEGRTRSVLSKSTHSSGRVSVHTTNLVMGKTLRGMGEQLRAGA